MRRLLMLFLVGFAQIWLGCSPPGSQRIAELEVEGAELTVGGGQRHALEIVLRAHRWPIVGGCPTIFVHLVDSSGKTVRSFDHRPPVWKPGEEIRYSLSIYQSLLAEPLPGGEYRLVLGAYHPKSGQKFRLRVAGSRGDKRRYEVGTVRIDETWQPPGRAAFGSGWYPPEAGTDVQVTQRRWFLDHARLEVSGPLAPGSNLRMLIYLPESEHLLEISQPPDSRREGWVRGDCLQEPVRFAPGRSEHLVPLPALADGEVCQLELASHFSFFDRGLRRSASLGGFCRRSSLPTSTPRLAAGRCLIALFQRSTCGKLSSGCPILRAIRTQGQHAISAIE